jgi:hypothetical protein
MRCQIIWLSAGIPERMLRRAKCAKGGEIESRAHSLIHANALSQAACTRIMYFDTAMKILGNIVFNKSIKCSLKLNEAV